MKNFPSFLCSIVLLFISCTAKPGENSSGVVSVTNKDSAAVDSTVRAFFKWYKHDYDVLNAVSLVNMDTTSGYSIDKDGVKHYVWLFGNTGYFTDELIAKMNTYFSKCDSALQVEKQKDGPPDGLDADLIICSQEPESDLQIIDSTRQFRITINGNNASCKIVPLNRTLTLSNKIGYWQFTSVGCFQ
ncbi:MAG TPA: hypothetical protein VL651_09290 [Bacteroidia bacterium]|jgi:hypothetical protein|nr:hypothetical protein [Bacteroidia bacterium]